MDLPSRLRTIQLPCERCFAAGKSIPPELCQYADGSSSAQAVVIGSAVPLVVYLCWLATIIGMGPGVPMVPAAAWVKVSYAELLPANSAAFYVLAQMCSFFAICAAFLGVAVGCSHFLADLIFSPASRTRRPFKVSPKLRRLLPLLLVRVHPPTPLPPPQFTPLPSLMGQPQQHRSL